MSRINCYECGNVIMLEAEIASISGSYVDPSFLSLTVEPVYGEKQVFIYGVDADFIRDGIGKYHRNYQIAAYGLHSYHFISSGTTPAVRYAKFHVKVPE